MVDDETGRVVGLQSLDLWSAMLPSMAHVGQLGTFVLPEWRGRGAGRLLWGSTEPFARAAGYRKLVIQVRASNLSAQAFYRTTAGFRECGRLSRQVVIDGIEDDEILMERFFSDQSTVASSSPLLRRMRRAVAGGASRADFTTAPSRV